MCGADVRGAGTDVIKVRGVEQMHGCTYSIIPDQIEAGSYMVAAAATGGDVLVKNVTPKHLELSPQSSAVRALRWRSLTMLCGFAAPATSCPSRSTPCPTRASPPICSPDGRSAQRGKGDFHRHRDVWDNRFRYVDELRKMGANVRWTVRWPCSRAWRSFLPLRSALPTCAPVQRWSLQP